MATRPLRPGSDVTLVVEVESERFNKRTQRSILINRALEHFELLEVQGDVAVALRAMEGKKAFAERRENERIEITENDGEKLVGKRL